MKVDQIMQPEHIDVTWKLDSGAGLTGRLKNPDLEFLYIHVLGVSCLFGYRSRSPSGHEFRRLSSVVFSNGPYAFLPHSILWKLNPMKSELNWH